MWNFRTLNLLMISMFVVHQNQLLLTLAKEHYSPYKWLFYPAIRTSTKSHLPSRHFYYVPAIRDITYDFQPPAFFGRDFFTGNKQRISYTGEPTLRVKCNAVKVRWGPNAPGEPMFKRVCVTEASGKEFNVRVSDTSNLPTIDEKVVQESRATVEQQ